MSKRQLQLTRLFFFGEEIHGSITGKEGKDHTLPNLFY